MKKFLLFTSLGLAIIASSCHRSNTWEIKGHITDASKATVILESSFNGNWFPVDTVITNNNGNFTLKRPAAQYPAIHRLSLDGKKAYFPVDSTETIIFEANAANFNNGYTLTGTQGAETLSKVNAMISAAGNDAVYNGELKRQLSQMVLEDPAGITAFYIINATNATGQPLFNTSNRSDLRIIGAVANAYTEQRPNDPRTEFLKNFFLTARRATIDQNALAGDTIVATEIILPEIELVDENGVTKTLSQVADGHPVVLNFTLYGAEFSPALNLELGKIFEQNAPKGLQIYQIAFDEDEFTWRQSAKNLPWITVFNSPKVGNTYLMKYNITKLPTTFIINGNGELVERVENTADIDTALKRHM